MELLLLNIFVERVHWRILKKPTGRLALAKATVRCSLSHQMPKGLRRQILRLLSQSDRVHRSVVISIHKDMARACVPHDTSVSQNKSLTSNLQINLFSTFFNLFNQTRAFGGPGKSKFLL